MTSSESESDVAKNGIYGWDATINAKDYTIDELKELLKEHAKTWVFQEEKGLKTNYLHYQLRCSLKVKTRKPNYLIKGHWSITSTADRADKSRYTSKCESRVSGPYRHDDKKMHRDLVGLILYDWQQYIVDLCKRVFPPRDERLRQINVLVDPVGSIGKGLLIRYLRYHLGAILVPPYRDIDRMAGYIAKLPRRSNLYIVDFPRDTKYKKLGDFYRGMENIKDGYLSDWRYTSLEDEMEMQPHIWIFANEVPNQSAMTANRWEIHSVESLTYEFNNRKVNPFRFENLVGGESDKVKGGTPASPLPPANPTHDPSGSPTARPPPPPHYRGRGGRTGLVSDY